MSFLQILLLVATNWRGAGNGTGRINGRTPTGSGPFAYPGAAGECGLLRWHNGDAVYVLTELGRSGPVPLAELSRRIGFDKSWTSRAVEHLVQDGLIEKVPSQTDHRMVSLSLSALGEQRLRDLNGTLGSLSERVMEQIPTSEHEGVQRSLSLLLAALQAEVE